MTRRPALPPIMTDLQHSPPSQPNGAAAHRSHGTVLLLGLAPAAEARFQAAQGLGVVWFPSMQWCPPLLGLLRRSETRLRDPIGLGAFLGLVAAQSACKFLLRVNRQSQFHDLELLEAFVLSGWLLYGASCLLLPAMPFRWLLRFGSMLVGCSIVVHHSQAFVLVRSCLDPAPVAERGLSRATRTRERGLMKPPCTGPEGAAGLGGWLARTHC